MGNILQKATVGMRGKSNKCVRNYLKRIVKDPTPDKTIKVSKSDPSFSEPIDQKVVSVSDLNPTAPKIQQDAIQESSCNQDLIDDNLVADAVLTPETSEVGRNFVPLSSEPRHLEQNWTISELVSEISEFTEIPIECRNEMITSLKEIAWQKYPEYFYDFCLIASDDDYEKAEDLKNELCDKFNLAGCMIRDFVEIGNDEFVIYENMMERCTKIFFYISDNFNDNNFCRRIQNGAVFQGLMSKARKEREKCVPVFPNGICRVPLALSGIGGLEIPSVQMTEKRIKLTYTDDVRQQRLNLEQKNHKDRRLFCLQFLEANVKEYEKKPKNPEKRRMSFKSKVDEGNRSFKCQNDVPPVFQNHSINSPITEVFSEIQKIVEKSSSNPVVTSSDVNITADSAHIGNQITVIINSRDFQQSKHKSSSDSSESDS